MIIKLNVLATFKLYMDFEAILQVQNIDSRRLLRLAFTITRINHILNVRVIV